MTSQQIIIKLVEMRRSKILNTKNQAYEWLYRHVLDMTNQEAAQLWETAKLYR